MQLESRARCTEESRTEAGIRERARGPAACTESGNRGPAVRRRGRGGRRQVEELQGTGRVDRRERARSPALRSG